jgi:sugar phosphate isomerase/epimerase
MGYDYVELAGLGEHKLPDWQRMLADAGLKPTSAHLGFDEIVHQTDYALDYARAFGVDYLALSLGGPALDTREAWEEAAAALDEAGGDLNAGGVQLCYHNHAHEFDYVDGERPFDLMFDNTRPDRLAAEIDVYWVRYGGDDPNLVLRNFSGRVPLLHVKDRTAAEPITFTEVGQGVMNWHAVFAAAREAGVQWYIVEQDACAGDSLESARISAEFMARFEA